LVVIKPTVIITSLVRSEMYDVRGPLVPHPGGFGP
jgi:hypothetical protein